MNQATRQPASVTRLSQNAEPSVGPEVLTTETPTPETTFNVRELLIGIFRQQLSLLQLQEEQLAELRHIRANLGNSSSSSTELKQQSKEVVVTVKHYASDSPEVLRESGDAVLEEFGRLQREVKARSLSGWPETLEQVAEANGLRIDPPAGNRTVYSEMAGALRRL